MSDTYLPMVGYKLVDVFAREQSYELVSSDTIDPGTQDRLAAFSWDWFPSAEPDEREFDIRLAIDIEPSKNIPEAISVDMIGTFSIEAKEPRIPLQTFVYEHAPTMLFPYIR